MCEISVIASTMAINLNPKGRDGHIDRMECYYALGDFDLALNDGLTILANFPPRDEYFEKYVEELRELVIFDISGNQIQSLKNGFHRAGYHSIIWDASSYSSGMYLAKMITDNYISTQKLILVK